MEILKKSVVIFLFTLSLHAMAQDSKIMAAFNKSYELEYGKKYDEAVSSFYTVYDPSSYELNLRLAYLYYLSGKNTESVMYYKRAAAIMPAAVEPLWAVINPLTLQEQWTEIEKTYYSILKIDPKNVSANYNLGYIFYYRKDYVSAKKYFDVSLNQYPFTYNYLLMSAWTNYYLGNKKDAQILFGKALYYKPNDVSALEGLGMLKK